MRCYNGCADSKLQAYIDNQVATRAGLKQQYPLAAVTYFPSEQQWHVFNDYQPVGDFEPTMQQAVHKALPLLAIL